MRTLLLHPASAAAGAIVVRAALTLWWGTFSAPRTFETETLTRNWFEGRGWVYTFLGAEYRSFHSAVPYDAVYAVAYGLAGGHPGANLVVQWLFAALLCVVVWRLGMRLGGPAVAGLGAWLAALHPGLVAYDATRLAQFSFDACLVAGTLLALVRWAERPSSGRAAAAGLLTALVMYERGTMGLFFPVALLWVRGTARLPWGRFVRQAALYGTVALLLILPWTVRNALVHQRFVFMSTTWFSLWQGNHEGAVGTEFTADGRPLKGALPAELRAQIVGKGELEQMAVFQDAALTFIRTQPARAAELYVRKLGFFWWRSPHAGIWYPGAWLNVYQMWYLVFMAFMVLGLVRLARGAAAPWAVARLIVWLAVCFSAGQAVFYIGGRHRWTIEPILGLLAASGSVWLSHRWWRRDAAAPDAIPLRSEGRA
jgi:hypothetical protein